MEPAFRIEGDVIRIANRRGRGQSICLGVMATVSAVLALGGPGALDALDAETAGPVPCLIFAALGLLAAFWWSEVTIDPPADEVLIIRRWGLWRSVYRRPLSSFESIVLTWDSDGDTWAFLAAKDGKAERNRNHAKSLIWGRPYEETRRMAAALAERLGLPLKTPAEEKGRLSSVVRLGGVGSPGGLGPGAAGHGVAHERHAEPSEGSRSQEKIFSTAP